MSRRLKPYPSYKDSGVGWLGQIPAHWEVKRFRHVTNRVDVGIAEAATHAYADEGVPILRSTNVRPNKILLDDILRIQPWFAEKNRSKYLLKQDIVTVRTGNAGVSAVIPDQLHKSQCFTMLISTMRPEQYAQFYCHLLNADVGQAVFKLEAWGTAQANISVPILREVPVVAPPFGEQQAIASFLDRETGKIDALVAKKERLIELLHEKRTAVISHAVTQGLNPNVLKKDSDIPWLGRIPQHWEIKRLSTVCVFEQGKAHEPFVDDTGEFICVNSRFISTEGASAKFCTANLTPAKPNDILMVMSDLPNGRALAKAYFVNDARNYAVNQRVCRLTAHKAHPRFLFYQLNRNEFFLQHDDGANQTHLYNALFTKFPALLPPLGEQRTIADFLDRESSRLDALMAKVRTAIERLQEYRTALISAAVTGQIDVRKEAQ
jgi:type I restriction enzyme S subunit